MRFQTERCLNPKCLNPQRPTNLPSHSHLDATGKYKYTPYWFCSAACYTKVAETYLPAEYQYDDYDGTSEYKKLVARINTDSYCEMYSYEYREKELHDACRAWRKQQKNALETARRQ